MNNGGEVIPAHLRELSSQQEAAEYRRLQARDSRDLWANRQNANNANNVSYISNNSLGIEMDFISMWSQVTEEQVKKIWAEFCLDMILLTIVVYLLEMSIMYQQSCGIPIKEWLMGFFIIYFSRSGFQVLKIFVLTHFYSYKTCYDFSAFSITNGIMCGWLIYGYVLFYSDANNCDSKTDTAFLNSMMFVILFIGYILMFVYLMLLCTVPCLYAFVRDSAQSGGRQFAGGTTLANAQVPSILASLTRVQYDPDKFDHETNCVICLVDYKPNDVVTQLRCDQRHYFHTECLEGWIKQGHNVCPFCRAPIENFGNQSRQSDEESMESDNAPLIDRINQRR